jgi:predicted porin
LCIFSDQLDRRRPEYRYVVWRDRRRYQLREQCANRNDTGRPWREADRADQRTTSGERWGLLGAEDLGGGYRAIFRLENGFTVNNGAFAQGGDEFGRQAYVGISGPTGDVTLGRQYDLVVDFVSPFVANRFAGYFASHPDDFDNLNQTFRVNNSIKYTSANFGGLTFGALYGFGGIAGSMGRNQVFSVGAHFARGPVELGVGYVNARDPNLSLYGNNANGGGATVNNIGANNPVIAGYASASTLQIIAAGGSYAIGPASINLLYTNTQFRGLGDLSAGPNPNGYRETATFHNGEIGLRYLIRPDLNLGLSYNFTHATGADNGESANYNQFNLGLDYFLSKRSDVYLLAGYQKANGHDSTSRTLSAAASFTNITPSAVDHQGVVRVGLRHTF